MSRVKCNGSRTKRNDQSEPPEYIKWDPMHDPIEPLKLADALIEIMEDEKVQADMLGAPLLRMERTITWHDERFELDLGEHNPKEFFEKSSFIPIRMVNALKKLGIYRFGYDEERGTGQLMIYIDGVFRAANFVEVVIQRLLDERSKQNLIKEAVEALKRDVPRIPWDRWNTNRLLVNCVSGMLDPSNVVLLEHSPEYLSTFQLPVRWNPKVKPNRVDSFLGELLPEAEIQVVLEMIGYMATSDISAKHFFVFEGEGNTGKTEFLNLVQNFIGSRNITITSLQDIADNRFALSGLENKLLSIFDDIGDTPIKSTSAIKVLTGKFSTIRVEHKGVDAYMAPLYARMLFTCNMMPACYTDHTEAWYNRPLIIPFKQTFTGDKVDTRLTDILAQKGCLERLFLLVSVALQRLMNRKMQFEVTTGMLEAAAKYRNRADTVAAFVAERCKLSPDESVNKSSWNTSYKDWCEESGRKYLGRNKAYDRLLSLHKSIVIDKERGGPNIFRGISIRTDFD